MKQTTLLILAAVLALSAGFLVKLNLSGNATTELTAADNLPDFKLKDISGQEHAISEWQGKVRVINFWATWCPPCLKEIPEFIKLQSQYANQGLQFIGVAIDDEQAVLDYAKTKPFNYPILMGAEEGIPIANQLGNKADVLPFTVIVDPEGRIIHRQQGELSPEKILSVVTPLLLTPDK